MRQEGFTPIGRTGQIATLGSQSAGGAQHGRDGAVAFRSDIAQWLSVQKPVDMDKAAVSRALSRNVGLRVRYEGRFPEGGPSYSVAVGCDVTGMPDEIQSALTDLRNFCTPPSVRSIEEWLAELSVITAKRQDDEFAEALRIEAYASRLARFPADVVRHVLLVRTWQFWPTWAEIETQATRLASPRFQMIAALERGAAPPEAARRAPTQDEKDRIAALVDEMFPQASQDWRDRAVADVAKGTFPDTGAAA